MQVLSIAGRSLSILLAVLALSSCGGPPLLEPQALDASQELWESRGPSSYSLELQVENGFVRRVSERVREGHIEKAVLRERDLRDV